MSHTATARAHANIALVKYWGKRDRELNLPLTGSLSLTLAALTTTATVEFVDAERDTLELDGAPVAGEPLARLSTWLDLVRARAGVDLRARVTSANDFPTASGLASSASAYAALAVAAAAAAGLDLDQRELSVLARRGSGSAARSIYGGLVLMHPGQLADGSDAFAESIAGADDWPLQMVIAVVGGGKVKSHSSRDAMEHCARTSPLFPDHIAGVPGDLAAALDAIGGRKLDALGVVAERSAMTMHATALAARPPIVYLKPATFRAIEVVRRLRQQGTGAYFTIDAGPHLKVLTSPETATEVAAALAEVDGVTAIITSGVGGGAAIAPEVE